MTASLFRVFGILAFTFAWLTYDHYKPWVNFHSEAIALAGIGLLALSACLSRSQRSVELPTLLRFVAFVAVVPWLQYLAGISLFAGDALIVSLYLFGFSVAIALGYYYATVSVMPHHSNELSLSIFYILWFAAIVSAVIGFLQWFSIQDFLTVYVVQTDIGDRAMGNLGQPNQLATLLLMGISALGWTYEQRRIGRLGLIVATLFLTFALVLTQSRAGMLSALAIAIFLIWKNWKTSSPLRPIFICIWFSGYTIALAALPWFSAVLLIGNIRSMDVSVDGARMVIWKQVVHGILKAPWFGFGWNQTPTAHAAGSIAVPGSLTFSYAHNIILDLLAWNGIPLGFLLIAVCCWWFFSRLKNLKKPTAIYAMAILIPILLHSLVEFPFAYSYFLLAAGIMIGFVEAYHPRTKTIVVNFRMAVGGLLLVFTLGSYMIYEYILIEEDFRIVRFENLKVGRTPEDYVVPNVWLLSHMGTMLKASRQKAVPGMSPESLENLRRASLRFPYGALAFRYAVALGLNGYPVEAGNQMLVIRGMYGETYYQAAVSVLRGLQAKEYPELATVTTP